MSRNKFIKSIVLILLAAGLLQAGITAYSTVSNQISRRYVEETAYAGTQNTAPEDSTVQEVQIPKEEIDISKVTLKAEVEAKITSLDAANAAKNIKNYKTLLIALDVPGDFQTEVEEMYNKGHKVQDTLIAYDFLYQNYGSIEELEGLIAQKESGKAWNTIFKEYKATKEEYQPRSFENGKLDQIFEIPGITTDDIMIADRIAQQTGMEFDELIAMRGQGMDWKTINEGQKIVNTSGELPRVAITSAQVINHMNATGLSEDQVMEALVLAQKLEKDGKAIVDKVKAGQMEEDIIAVCLEEKYQ